MPDQMTAALNAAIATIKTDKACGDTDIAHYSRGRATFISYKGKPAMKISPDGSSVKTEKLY